MMMTSLIDWWLLPWWWCDCKSQTHRLCRSLVQWRRRLGPRLWPRRWQNAASSHVRRSSSRQSHRGIRILFHNWRTTTRSEVASIPGYVAEFYLLRRLGYTRFCCLQKEVITHLCRKAHYTWHIDDKRYSTCHSVDTHVHVSTRHCHVVANNILK